MHAKLHTSFVNQISVEPEDGSRKICFCLHKILYLYNNQYCTTHMRLEPFCRTTLEFWGIRPWRIPKSTTEYCIPFIFDLKLIALIIWININRYKLIKNNCRSINFEAAKFYSNDQNNWNSASSNWWNLSCSFACWPVFNENVRLHQNRMKASIIWKI